MAEPLRNYQARVATAGTRADAAIDQGLRAYMIRVYNLMALGLEITGLAALGTMMLATTNDPSAAVATLGNGKMLTAFGPAIYGSPSARCGAVPDSAQPPLFRSRSAWRSRRPRRGAQIRETAWREPRSYS